MVGGGYASAGICPELPAQCLLNSASRQRLSNKPFPFHSAFFHERMASWNYEPSSQSALKFK